MNLKIRKEVLEVGLNAVSKVVGQRSVVPILSNVLLEGNGKSLKVSGTNLEAAVSIELEIVEIGEFATTVPSRKRTILRFF